MSLVDVRGAASLVDTSGPGPGAGRAGRAGCLGPRGAPGSPLASPLTPPLDSPLGSPLGAVSLDAAVFVAKGGLTMLDDSPIDPRADSFADACGKPSDANPPFPQPPNASPPSEPGLLTSCTATPTYSGSCPGATACQAHGAEEGAPTDVGSTATTSGGMTTRSSGRATRSSVAVADVTGDASPETTRTATKNSRETRSRSAARDGADAVGDARTVTRATRRARRTSTPGPPSAPSPGPAPSTEEETASTGQMEAESTSGGDLSCSDADDAESDERPHEKTRGGEEGPPDMALRDAAQGDGLAATNEGTQDTFAVHAAHAAHEAHVAHATAPSPETTTATAKLTLTSAIETAAATSTKTSESTASATNAVPICAAVVGFRQGAPASTCADPASTPETANNAAPDCTPGGDGSGAAETAASLGAPPSTLLLVSDEGDAISGDAAPPAENSHQPMEQKQPALVAAVRVAAPENAVAVGSPARRFLTGLPALPVLPSKRPRLAAQMSTEVTDALGRKNCLLPSLPRHAKTAPISSAVVVGCPPGGILSRALTGGLPTVKLAALPLPKSGDCLSAIDPKFGARGSPALAGRAVRVGPVGPVGPVGILARTLSAPADLLPTSTSSEAALRPFAASPAATALPLLTAPCSKMPALAAMTTPSKTILLNPILSKALSPTAAFLPQCPPKPVGATAGIAAPRVDSKQAEIVKSDMASQTLVEVDTVPAMAPSDDPRSRTRSITSPSASNTSASPAPSLAPSPRGHVDHASHAGHAVTGEDGDTASRRGLSDSCASSSSLSAATSPCAPPCAPPSAPSCAPPSAPPSAPHGVLGLERLDSIAVPEPASCATPLFSDSPDDLIGVADALNALSAADDDAVGSSQDSTQLSGGSASSISSCCSGSSSCSNLSMSSSGGCCGAARQRPRVVSPSRLGPQQCQVCAKVFSNASALAKHKLTHSDERRYVCSVCNKAFKRQDHLNGHMLTHRNKKPYECVLEGCNKSYCDARSLRRHEENHHHVKPLSTSKDKEGEKPRDKEGKKKNPKSFISLLTTDSISAENSAKSLDSLSESNDTLDDTYQLGSATSTTLTIGISSPVESNGASSGPGIVENETENAQVGAVFKSSPKSLSKTMVTLPLQFTSTAVPKCSSVAPLIIPSLPSSAISSSNEGGLIFTTAVASMALTSPVPVQSLVTPQPQPSPIRIPQVPTPLPISIPSVRPQLLSTRIVPSKPPAQLLHTISHTNNQYGKLDQTNTQTASTLAGVNQNSQEKIIQSNFVPSFIASPQQLPVVQLAISQASVAPSSTQVVQAQLALPHSQQLSVQSIKLEATPGLQAKPVAMQLSGKTGHLTMASSQRAHAFQTSVAGKTSGRAPPLQRQVAIDSSIETFQLHVAQQSPLLQPVTSGTLTSATLKTTILTNQQTVASKIVSCDQRLEGTQKQRDGQELVAISVQKGTARVASLHQKKALPKAGLVNEIPATSTSICAPVSTSTTTTTTTTIASTIALTLSSTKSSTTPVLISSNMGIKTCTNTSSSPGISSCKVSSTAHLGSVRDTQIATGSQPIRQNGMPVQDDVKKDPKGAAAAGNSPQNKPVACTLCNRRFKNIPALNGHMRLHGGFFKKESESKRSDKRESTGPPLQTASVSVRQLIEEKIIQKRGGAIGRVALLAGRESSVSSSSSHISTGNTTTTVVSGVNAASVTFVHSRDVIERGRHNDHLESSFKKVVGNSECASTVLQHHNYANSSFPTPPSSTNVSNANSPPPPPLSPLTCASFLPLSPQSEGSEPHQLLIHSEDPLLSSTIKDITRKKIDLGSLTVLGSVLVERGGELHLIQAPTAIVHKLSSRNTKQKPGGLDTSLTFTSLPSHSISTSLSAPAYQTASNFFKHDDIDDEVFLSPSMVPDSPLSLSNPARSFCTTSALSANGVPTSRSQTKAASDFSAPPAKRPRLSNPYPAHKSRLRNCRREAICSASMPYTPAPMLDPNRCGTGLIAHANSPWHCSSTTTDGDDSCDAMAISAPESDSFPHVNVGTRFQCAIPLCEKKPYDHSSQDYLMWEPEVTSKSTDAEVDAYLEFACCDAIPWGGRNQEYALHVLHMCGGDVQEAMVQLMQRNPTLPSEHLLLSYNYGITDLWNVTEMDSFVKALSKHVKNWALVANEVRTKTAKECVQFYYLWKKLCPDEYNLVKSNWQMQEKVGDDMNNNLNLQEDAHSNKLFPILHQKKKIIDQNAGTHSNAVREIAALFPSSTEVEEILNLQRTSQAMPDTDTKVHHQIFTSSLNPNVELMNSRSDSVAEQVPNNIDSTVLLSDEKMFCTQEFTKEEALSQQLQENNVELTEDCNSLSNVSQNLEQTLECLKSEDLILDEIKREPWEFCIKEEIKQELEGSFDLAEAKKFISEFDNIKLNHMSDNAGDIHETVEDAPIIVTELAHSHNDPHDQVKIEIESMMALHGIRVEDDSNNDVVNATHLFLHDEHRSQTVDRTIVKDSGCSLGSAITEEHVSTSSDSRLFVCELTDCSASFNSRAALNGHIRIHGYRKSPPPPMTATHRSITLRQDYPCETCGKTFAKLKSRNAHMKTHKLISADISETLAGRATGVSSSDDVPLTTVNNPAGLTFSTCLDFGLSVDSCRNTLNTKDLAQKESLVICINNEKRTDSADKMVAYNICTSTESAINSIDGLPTVHSVENSIIGKDERDPTSLTSSLTAIPHNKPSQKHLFTKSEICEELTQVSEFNHKVTSVVASYENVSQLQSPSTSTTFTGRVAVTSVTSDAQDKFLQQPKLKRTTDASSVQSKGGLCKKIKTKSKCISAFSSISRSR